MRRALARLGAGAALLPWALSILAASPGTARAQAAPEEQARRLLEDGRAYWEAGKHKQALDNFQTIVSGFPNTDSVDDALLEIGRYHAEVERDVAKARESFDQVAKRFPQSDGAPGAYYSLGWYALRGARTAADLDDAQANFDRVERLYPRSPWVPRALLGTALVHRQAGRLPEAVDAARRVAFEYPTSPAAPAAQFEVGHLLALLGEPRQAMEEFQQVRNRYPAHALAAVALDRVTALFRLHGGPQASFAADPSFALAAGEGLKEVRALLSTPDGTLWVASEKVRSAVPFSRAGTQASALPAEEPRALALGPDGELVLTSKLAVRAGGELRSFTIPGEKPGETRPLDRLTAAVLTRGGALLVADEERKRVFRYEGRQEFKGVFPADGRERQVTRMALDAEGAVLLLDREARVLSAFDENGKALRSLGPRGTGWELRKPADFAVDSFRNLYVADEDAGVLVLSPQGRLLATLGRDELRKAKAVAVEPGGAVLVYDEKAQRVLRFR